NSEVHAFYLEFPTGSSTTFQGTIVAPTMIDGSSSGDYERPRINQVSAGPASNAGDVAYPTYSYSFANDDWDVGVAVYDHNGVQSDLEFLEPFNGRHKLGPVVAGESGRYLVAYTSVDLAVLPTKTQARSGFDANAMR